MTNKDRLIETLIDYSVGLYDDVVFYDDLFFYEVLKRFVSTLSGEECEQILIDMINQTILINSLDIPQELIS